MSEATENHYQNRGNFIQFWKIRSKELYEAAKCVWEGKVLRTPLPNGKIDEIHQLYRPAQLLMGMSLEVLLKGLIIEQTPGLIVGEKLPKELNTHSLEKLFQKTNISIKDNEEELNFIRKLSDAIEWVAKYPIPIHANHLRQSKHKSKSVMTRNDYDFDRFCRLRNRIESKFNKSN